MVTAIAATAAVLMMATGQPARGATTANFTVRTTADLVALCSTTPTEENYVAAIHFCQGFGVGAYQYYLAIAANNPADRFVCLSDPPPTRDAVKAGFIAWTQANPNSMSQPAVDSLFRYLAQSYPCTDAQRQAPAH
jgi:Rap1a immunity proteins